MASRAEYAVRKLIQLGWTPVQAAAIVGHLQHESADDNLNTSAAGDRINGQPTSFGIAQWHKERNTALRNFAAAKGKPWDDLDVQLEFLNHELNTSERAAGQALRGANDLYSATAAFGGFERPLGYSRSNPEGMHGWSNRWAKAQAINQLGIADGAQGPDAINQLGMPSGEPSPDAPRNQLGLFSGELPAAAPRNQLGMPAGTMPPSVAPSFGAPADPDDERRRMVAALSPEYVRQGGNDDYSSVSYGYGKRFR